MGYFYITTILLKTFLRFTWISFIFRLQVLSGGLYNLVFCNQECNSSILMHKIANLCTDLIDLVQFSLSTGWQVGSQPWHDKMYLHLHQEWNMTHTDQTQWGNYWNSQSEWRRLSAGPAGSTVGDRRGAEDSKWLKIFSFLHISKRNTSNLAWVQFTFKFCLKGIFAQIGFILLEKCSLS